MNEVPEASDEQLRLATSRAPLEGATLAADTAAMREVFLALGCALESAAGQLDEATLIERLAESRTQPERTCELPSKSMRRTHDWWAALLGSALAAAALLAMAGIALQTRQNVAA